MIHGKLLLICTICDRLLITTTTTTTTTAVEWKPSTPAMVTTTTVQLTTTPAAAAVGWGGGEAHPAGLQRPGARPGAAQLRGGPQVSHRRDDELAAMMRYCPSAGRRAAGATAGGARSRGTTDTMRGVTGQQLIVNTTITILQHKAMNE